MAFYSVGRLIGGSLALTALCWCLYSNLAPKETYVYGPDGRWLQDSAEPNKAFDLKTVGHVATWSKLTWTDNKGKEIKLGPPPPPGWTQNEKDPFQCTGPQGELATWDGQNSWRETTGKLVWQIPSQ